MNLSDFATEMAAKNNFIKASFGGFAGSGKSLTAAHFVAGSYKDLGCKNPVLIIDNEKGSRFLIPFFKEHGIKVMLKDTVMLADVIQAMRFLSEGQIDFLFIDSLTKVWYKYIREYRDKNNISFMSLEHWGKVIPSWQERFADNFVECEGNIVFTGRGGYQYDLEEEDVGNGRKKRSFVKSGVKMKMAGETPFEPDLNVWMNQEQDVQQDGTIQVWREAQIMKDRSSLIDGQTFKNPTYDAFKPVVQYLISVPKGDVAGQSASDSGAPTENWDRANRREKREIELEKIKACFDKLGLGSSKDDKQLKIAITEKFFYTTSAKEIEKIDLETLEIYRKDVEVFTDELLLQAPEKWSEFTKEYRLPKTSPSAPTINDDDLPD